VLCVQRQWEAALAGFDRAIALEQHHAEAHSNRGFVLHELRRLDEAIASCNRAIALKPGYAQAYCNRGSVLWPRDRSRRRCRATIERSRSAPATLRGM